ncbi:MAG TPA: hypothetical protein VFK82_07790 [Burkholderiaceae bacterium]|nr:hypothetical protein [Burkholderiaceae bacterium]
MPADRHNPPTGATVLVFRRPAAGTLDAQPAAQCPPDSCPAQGDRSAPCAGPEDVLQRLARDDLTRPDEGRALQSSDAVLLASLITLMSSFAQRAATGQVCPALAWRVERHLAELAEQRSLHPVLRETAEQLLSDWDQLDQRLAADRTPGGGPGAAPAVCNRPTARPEWLRWILGPAD